MLTCADEGERVLEIEGRMLKIGRHSGTAALTKAPSLSKALTKAPALFKGRR
jgi:hypothetical protein